MSAAEQATTLSSSGGQSPGRRPGIDYPAAPWLLVGQLNTSIFLLDPGALRPPPAGFPPGWHPLRLGGHCVVATAWVSYEAGSVLEYRELMCLVLLRRGWRLWPSITQIWVDSTQSRDGGRALWGIPKELADFGFASRRRSAAVAGRHPSAIARGSVRPRARIPVRLPIRFTVVQIHGGAAKVTAVRARARLDLDAAEFVADRSGPLGFLAGHRPRISLTLRDFVMSFGRQ